MSSASKTTTPTAGTVAATLTDLLAYHDLHFVASAYTTVLGRDPDPEGLAYYLGRLRAGIPKIRILADLRTSREGRQRKLRLSGLDQAIRRYRIGQLPLLGWVFRLVRDTEGNAPIERKLRTLENQILLLSEDNHRHLAQIEQRLADLHRLTEPVVQIVLAAIDGTNGPILQDSDQPSTTLGHDTSSLPTTIPPSDLPHPKSSLRTLIDAQVSIWTK